MLVSVTKKGALRKERRPLAGAGGCPGSGGRQRLAGAVGKPSERVGVADGDVGQDLAVQLHAGELEAVHELRIGEVVLPGGRVDARDPQPAEVPLAVAAIAI